MKLSNFLDHPALNQLRLSMGADSLAAPPRGWTPRLLDAESVMRLGQPEPLPPSDGAIGPGAPSARKMKSAPKVPVHYSRDSTSSRILNPIGLPKGAIADDIPEPEAPPSAPSALPAQIAAPPQQAGLMGAPATPAPTHRGQPETAQQPAQQPAKPAQPMEPQQHERRRRRNQAALEKLRGLQGD
jgi:hypothetical protein